MRILFSTLAVGACLAFSSLTFAQSTLENPQPGAAMSGIGPVSGWRCGNGVVTIQFDNGPIYVAGSGTIRDDTIGVCGDNNNGFSFLWNWNKLGDGNHIVRAFENGVQFAQVSFSVQTLGQEFRTGLDGTVTVPNFPSPGQTTVLEWQEAQQNFVIVDVTGGSTQIPNVAGQWHFDVDFLTEDCNFLSVPGDLPTSLVETLFIMQNGSQLSSSSGGLALTGEVEANGDFALASEPEIISAGGCTAGIAAGYGGNFFSGSAIALFVADRISGSCLGLSLPCSILYGGSVTKVLGQTLMEPGVSLSEGVKAALRNAQIQMQ